MGMLPQEPEPIFLLENLLIILEQLERVYLTGRNSVQVWDTYPEVFCNSIGMMES